MTAARVVVTLAVGQNAFFVELAEAIAAGLRRLGTPAEVMTGMLPAPEPGVVPLLLPPHEVGALGGRSALQDPQLLARSIAVCAEQPGSSWFHDNLDLVRRMGAVFDLSDQGVAALAQHQVGATRLDLGHVPEWDNTVDDPHAGRDLDVVFLGSATPRRLELLSRCAAALAPYQSCLVVSDNAAPNAGTGAGFYAGSDKRALLRRARVVLNLHRDDQPYMEWLRVMDVLHAGAVLVTESAADLRDLEPGRHVVVSRTASIPDVLAAVLADDKGLRQRREAALSWLRARPFEEGLKVIAEQAAALGGRPWTNPAPAFERTQPSGPVPRIAAPEDPTAVALKRSVLEGIGLCRRVDALERAVAGAGTSTEVVGSTPAWEGPRRRIAVIVPTFRHAHVLASTIDSALHDPRDDLEIVVVDDGSPDNDAAVACEVLRSRPDVPILVVRHPVNRGLGAARNTGVGLATADRLLMLDADNELLPGAVARLDGALSAAPDAPMAYGMLATWSPQQGPTGLLSYWPWQPQKLIGQNYVDALAMLRRSTLEQMGGYSEELTLYGWEDYDLWLGIIDLALAPAFVPELVARYRRGQTSMLSVSNISHADAFARLRERHLCMRAAG